MKDILRIEFAADRKTAKVTSRRGDVLNVELDLAEFRIDTVFGTVSLPAQHIKTIRDPNEIRVDEHMKRIQDRRRIHIGLRRRPGLIARD